MWPVEARHTDEIDLLELPTIVPSRTPPLLEKTAFPSEKKHGAIECYIALGVFQRDAQVRNKNEEILENLAFQVAPTILATF